MRKEMVDELVRALGPPEGFGSPPGYAVLRAFLDAHSAGRPPDKETMAAIAAAFGRILKGERADHALGIVHGKRSRPPSRAVALKRTEAVVRLTLLRSSGRTVDQAIEEVRKELHMGRGTVETLHKKYVAGGGFRGDAASWVKRPYRGR